MSNIISLPVLITSLSTKVDGSIAIKMETQEFGATESALLFELRGKSAWALISPTEIKDSEANIPHEKPDPAIGLKTPSQRLRSVLYRLWEQQHSGTDFESYYRIRLEGIIDQIKEKLN